MTRSLLLALAGVVVMSQSAMAGWYKVDNFEGSIGPDPVHFSLQSYEFGSGITVEGSYYLDDQRSPVTVYGTRDGDEIRLCEIADAEEFRAVIIYGSSSPVDTSACPFTLVVDGASITGSRQSGGEIHPVVLDRVARLDDTGPGEIEGEVAIPFWEQTESQMFVGIYTKTEAGICMETLQVVGKADGKVAQEIGFDDEYCDAGAVMTPIYMNVEAYDDDGTPLIAVNFRDGGAGYSVDYVIDPQTGLLAER